MAWTVKVIRNDNPKHDTAGTSTYAAAVDSAIGDVAKDRVVMASAWDPETGGVVTTIAVHSD